ncbi:hypothetical protein [Deinococcus sp. UYEF24]
MRHKSDGYAIVFVLSLLALMGMMVISYAFLTRSEIVSSRNTARSTTGFYAAEAALNARAETFRSKFQGFLIPAGTSPDINNKPCVGNNTGSGDFACQVVTVNGRNVTSYVVKLNTQTIQIGAGEQYANLNAEETQFVVYGQALNPAGNPEAITQLVFRSRLVPLFQFAIFFNKDLEFDNTATLDLVGPVHANGNIFLDSGNTTGTFLHIGGQVTSSQTLYRGQKSQNYCGGTVNVDDLTGSPLGVSCSGSRRAMTAAELSSWNGQMRQGVPAVTVPDVSSIQPVSSSLYWAQADVRVVLKPVGIGWGAELQDANGGTIVSSTALAALCPAALTSSNTFLDNREAKYWNPLDPTKNNKRLLDVNMSLFTSCITANSTGLGIPPFTSTSSDKGLVYYFTVKDGGISQGTGANNYGVRLYNGASLHSTTGTGRIDKGLTVVSDQALIVQGDYNTNNKVPAALLADSMNVLSNSWSTATPCDYGGTGGAPRYWAPGTAQTARTSVAALSAVGDAKSAGPMSCRLSSNTTINAAVVAGTDTSGYNNGVAATEGGLDNGTTTQSGGVHNMMRFQEDWGGNTPTALTTPAIYTYRGSLVSLGRPQHARGQFAVGGTVYQPPRRNWSFDTDFRNSANLPPLSPRFVYLKQDNFVRNFQQ